MLRQVLHARPPQPLPGHRVTESRDHRAPLLVIMPEFRLEPVRRRMGVHQGRGDTLNLGLPVLSLLGVTLEIVKNPLFRAVETHGANLPRQS